MARTFGTGYGTGVDMTCSAVLEFVLVGPRVDGLLLFCPGTDVHVEPYETD